MTIYHCEIGMSCKYTLWEVFENDKVHELVSENFIFNFLSVCDRTKLEDSYTIQYNGHNRLLETIGDVNMNREIVKYNRNTQPIYAITDFNDVDMVEHITDSDFAGNDTGLTSFLEKGLKEFNKQYK